jgi:hypothetical protein
MAFQTAADILVRDSFDLPVGATRKSRLLIQIVPKTEIDTLIRTAAPPIEWTESRQSRLEAGATSDASNSVS